MDLLYDLLLERLSGLESGKLFETCAQCFSEAGQLNRLIELMSTDTGEDAPLDVIDRANQLFKSRAISV